MAKGEAQSASTKAAPKAKAKSAPKADGEKGAPRPRKFDYGITDENKVRVTNQEGEVKLKNLEAEGYEVAKKGPTVKTFLEKSNRAILRRLSRKGLIEIVAKDGTVYPKEYVAPKAEAEAA